VARGKLRRMLDETLAGLPIDPERGPLLPRLDPAVLGVIFLGGVAGGLTRYAATEVWPAPDHGFPWATFGVNTVGAFALGLVVTLLADVLAGRKLARPLLGTGFLGAFTTFSSVMTTTDQLLSHDHASTAIAYLLGSVLAALGAVSFGLLTGRAVVTNRQRETT
jgi:CrcB protein